MPLIWISPLEGCLSPLCPPRHISGAKSSSIDRGGRETLRGTARSPFEDICRGHFGLNFMLVVQKGCVSNARR